MAKKKSEEIDNEVIDTEPVKVQSKYNVIADYSVPEIRLGLQKGTVLDVAAFNAKSNYTITDEIISRLKGAGIIE